MKTMRFDEWIPEQQNAILAFWQFWMGRNAEQPQGFPLELPTGDWDEQFGLFKEKWLEAIANSGSSETKEEAPDNVIPFPFKIQFECPDCRGSGLVTAYAGRVVGQHKCPKCDGKGKIK